MSINTNNIIKYSYKFPNKSRELVYDLNKDLKEVENWEEETKNDELLKYIYIIRENEFILPEFYIKSYLGAKIPFNTGISVEKYLRR